MLSVRAVRTLWICGLIILSGLSGIERGQANSVTLAWDRSSAPDIMGYKLYYGVSSGVYTNLISVGNLTNASVSGLNPGVTYYMAATAINAAGLESAFSDEIVYQVPLNKATITLAGLAQMYDGNAKVVQVTTVPSGLAVSLSYNGVSAAPTNAGSYTVVATVNNANYTGSVTNTLVIAKAQATVSLNLLSQVYDGTAKPVQSITIPSGLAVALKYNGKTKAPTNAGNYTVTGTINNANYTGAATNTLVIAQASATIAMGGLHQTYDGTAKRVQVTSSPVGLTVQLEYNGNASAPVNAGTYLVVGTVSDTNYFGVVTNTLVIGQAEATIVLNGLSQTFDGTAKVVQAISSPGGLAIGLTYNGSSKAPTNAGAYTVVGVVDDPNYVGAVTNTLVIGQGQANIVLNLLNQIYDGTAKPVQASTKPSGLAVSLTYDGNAQAPTNAGTYMVVGAIHDLNYTGAATNTLVIAQASATITLAGLHQTYDGIAKPVQATSSPAGLTVQLKYNGNDGAPINAGTYTVVGTVSDTNYVGGITNTLVIGQAEAAVVLSGLNQTFDGTAKPVQTISSPAGLAIGLTYNGSSTAPTNAGAYTVVGVVDDPNYVGAVTNTLWIGQAQGNIALNFLNQVYDGTAKPVQASTMPSGLAVSLTYDGNAQAPTNTGTYVVVGTINDLNYTGAATNTLVIAQASATITLAGLHQTYDGIAKPVQATSSPAGLTVQLKYNGNASAPINAGTYTVVGTVSDTNYVGGITNTLVIGQAEAAVVLSGLNQTFDGTAKVVQAISSPAGLEIGLTYNGSTKAPTNAGAYTVIGVVDDPNFIGAVTNTLLIGQGQANIALNFLNQVYDGTAKPVQVSTTPSGLAVSVTYDGSAQAPTNTGTYVVVGTINDLNYRGAVTNTLMVQQALATVTLGNLVQVFNGAPKSVTVATSPKSLSTTVTYNGKIKAPTKVGHYTVVALIKELNWCGGATNTLTIQKAPSRLSPAPSSIPLAVDARFAPGLSLQWEPTPGTVAVYQSTDLNSWQLLTTTNGLDGQLRIEPGAGDHFFRADVQNSSSTNSLPLRIGRE